ncbi:MAG: cell envelope integrity protein CreD [Gammaproteobacteria bacterium]|nr:cell envelope integrity protein CreD [Gammaproteobacteria bacterium]
MTEVLSNDENSSSDTTAAVRGVVNKIGGSLTLRVAYVAGLALAMLVPVLFLTVTVSERGGRYQQVLYDIASSWGHEQMIQGPVIEVPYTRIHRYQETITMANGQDREIEKSKTLNLSLYILPTTLALDINLDTESRHRGIYHSLVYRADVLMDAQFSALKTEDLPPEIETIHWDRATVAFGLSDSRAVEEVKSVLWNNKPNRLKPGHTVDPLNSGFHLRLTDFDPFREHSLKLDVSVRGSGSLMFTPFGEMTEVSLTSSWPHPSFIGRVLPVTREITESGFSASYAIPHLARTYPQVWSSDMQQVNLTELTAGVRIFEPVSLYVKIQRSVKYAVLFIGLTFLLMLVFEQAVATRMHAVQYILVGCALALFYLVLLSLSEHIAFILAYLLSAIAIVLIISVYVGVVLRSKWRGFQMLSMMSLLYGVLYSLLQLEDYALLLGTSLLFAVLVSLMLVTKNLAKRTISESAQVSDVSAT